MAMLVSWSGRTLIGNLAVIGGPWVNLRHGRGPRDQITVIAKRGNIYDSIESPSLNFFSKITASKDNNNVRVINTKKRNKEAYVPPPT